MALPPFNQQIADGIMAAQKGRSGLQNVLGMEIVEASSGRMVVHLPVRDDLLTPFGNLHGGVIAALVDHALGTVLYPHMAPGQWAATTEFKLNYLAPVRSGTLVAESTIVSMSKRTAVVRADVTNEGRLVAAAQGTLLIQEAKAK